MTGKNSAEKNGNDEGFAGLAADLEDLEGKAKGEEVGGNQGGKDKVKVKRLSPAMEQLVVDYAATAHAAESLEETNWAALAERLRLPVGMIQEAIEALGEEGKQALWYKTVDKRIAAVSATRGFVRGKWDMVESQAVTTLLGLLEKGVIRDADQLVKIAQISEGINRGGSKNNAGQGHGPSVSIHMNGFGDASLSSEGDDMDGQRLPDGSPDRPLRISLAPRTAQALQQAQQRSKTRIIDAERVDVDTLRSASVGKGDTQ